MIDSFSLLLTHSLLLLAAWRFMQMSDHDPDEKAVRGDTGATSWAKAGRATGQKSGQKTGRKTGA